MILEKRVSLVDLVVNHILSSIKDGRFKNGNRLPSMAKIAKTTSVSMSTIREAIKRLESLGVLEVRQGDGTYIRQINIQSLIEQVLPFIKFDDASLSDLLEARMILELETARLSAERADEQAIKELEAICAKMAETENDSETYTELDSDFHIGIARATQNSLLVEYILVIRDIMRRQQEYVAQFPDVRRASHVYHERILRAIQLRRPDEARTAMREHLSAIPYRFMLSSEAVEDGGESTD